MQNYFTFYQNKSRTMEGINYSNMTPTFFFIGTKSRMLSFEFSRLALRWSFEQQ